MSAKDKLFETIGEVSINYTNCLDEPLSPKQIKTGLTGFDLLTNGLQLGTLTILAARPSMGKTTLALNIAENIAIKQEIPLAFFSFEMDNKDRALSIFSSLNAIDKQTLETLQCSHDELHLIKKSTQEVSKSPLFFSSACSMSLQDVCDNVELMTKDENLKIVIIDYLQLFKTTYSPDEDHSARILEITHALRLLAVKLNIAIVALSHIDRGLEKRPDKRPVLSDLGLCGDIAQDASLVVFIYRDAVYNENSPNKDVAEIIIAKNNHGAIGTTLMTLNGHLPRFEAFH